MYCTRRSVGSMRGRAGGVLWVVLVVAVIHLGGLRPCERAAWARDKATAPAPSSAPAVLEAPAPLESAPPGPNAPMKAFWSYARERFAQGDYVAAAIALEQAYAREPQPNLLFNVGQAYRKASRYEEAIRAYERFLQVTPAKHPVALEVTDYIRTMRLLMAQQDRQKQIELAMEQTQEELMRYRKPPIYKRAWFWATIVGATATVVGIGVGIKVYQDQRTTDTGMLSLQF